MTGRAILAELVTSFRGPAITKCNLVKVSAVGLPPFGLTSLDRDVLYDDGTDDGIIRYHARTGISSYTIDTSADLSVDNSQVESLIATFDLEGFTVEEIRQGAYDYARFVQYVVNYLNLSEGHVIINSGFIGQVRTSDGLLVFPEMRSLSQTLKQKSIIERGSNNCRAIHGDERCKFPVETLWVDAVITDVGDETDRVVTVNGAAIADDALKPGFLKVIDGANAGRTYEIESNVGNEITLAFPSELPFVDGVAVQYRPACTNLWSGPNSCEFYETLRPGQRLDFRGEPHRPVADTASLMVPKPSRTD